MIAKVGYLVFDAVDSAALAEFWCAVLGVSVDYVVGDGEFVALTPSQSGLSLVFQSVSKVPDSGNRLHLDLLVDDLDVATGAVENLGGRWSEERITHELDGFRWRTMVDPEGNVFDLQVQPTP